MSEHINAFPGYEFVYDPKDNKYHNIYRGVDVGKGGWVYSDPGIYSNIALLDAASLHPCSIIELNKLGEYTSRYAELKQARVYIKHKDFESAKKLFDGKLAKYLNDPNEAKALSKALKLPINAFFGISFATFPNPARDSRDKNNIIALRGALFMKTLFDEVEARGFHIIHVKTDSVKIPNATPEIIKFVQDFGKKYGYDMEHEATYERMCLIDDAQYIATFMRPEKCQELYGYIPGDNEDHFRSNSHAWTATGNEFKRPYIFKTLFSGEEPSFDDLCETKSVKDAAIYLDFNENMPDVEIYEKELGKRLHNIEYPDKKEKLNSELTGYSDEELRKEISKGHNYSFIGRVGRFYPVKPGTGGGLLVSQRDNKYNYVSGSKGHRWIEAEIALKLHKEGDRDPSYYQEQIDKSIKKIEKSGGIGSFERFIDLSRPYEPPEQPDIPEASEDDSAPWDELPPVVPCGDPKYNTCLECPNCKDDICKNGYSLNAYIEKGAS